MTFDFPANKSDFTAENGVTYTWDVNRWRTKAYKIDDAELANYVTTEAFTEGQGKQDQLIDKNARSIEELEVTKGPVARYECKGTSLGIASRNGELYVNSPNAADVTTISFAPFDLNGNPTRPVAAGDIIEFVEDVSTTRNTGEVSRFRVESGDDAQALNVVYLNGANNFAVGEVEDVYIYPQNGENASKEYVDTQDALKVDRTTANEVSTAHRIKSDGKTIFSFGTAGAVKIYHLVDPSESHHALNLGYADGRFAKSVDLDAYLPIAGGRMTGGLTIARSSGDDDRFAVSNTSYTSFWIPQSHEAHCRGRMYINSYREEGSNGRRGDANKLATIQEARELAEEAANAIEIPEIPVDDGKVVVPSGTSVPALQQGELFYNTSTKDLCIGA